MAKSVALLFFITFMSVECFAGGGGIGDPAGSRNFLFCISADQAVTFEVYEACFESNYYYCNNSVYGHYKGEEFLFDMNDSFNQQTRSGKFKDESNGFKVDIVVGLGATKSYIQVKDAYSRKVIVPRTEVVCSPR